MTLWTALHLCLPQAYVQAWGAQATHYRDIQDKYLDRYPALREGFPGGLGRQRVHGHGFEFIITDDPLQSARPTQEDLDWWYSQGMFPGAWRRGPRLTSGRICQRCAGLGWDEGDPCPKCLWACQACAELPDPRGCQACEGHGLTFANGKSIGPRPRPK